MASEALTCALIFWLSRKARFHRLQLLGHLLDHLLEVVQAIVDARCVPRTGIAGGRVVAVGTRGFFGAWRFSLHRFRLLQAVNLRFDFRNHLDVRSLLFSNASSAGTALTCHDFPARESRTIARKNSAS